MNTVTPQTRRWQGHWIAPDGKDEGRERAPNSYYLFRREFTVAATIKATLFISADTVFRLYLDGVEIGTGPVRSQCYNMYYEAYPVTLEKGCRCLAAEVYYQGIDGAESGSRIAFLCEGVDAYGESFLMSDAAWRSIAAPQWARNTQLFRMNRINAFQEFFDAGKVPVDADGRDWRSVGFDDREWRRSVEIAGRIAGVPPMGGNWSLLQERDIPQMESAMILPESICASEECLCLMNRIRPEDVSIRLSMPGKPVDHATIRNAEALISGEDGAVLRCSTDHLSDRTVDGYYDPCLTLDFGRQQTAYLELELEGPAGALVEFGFAERLIDGRFNNSIEGYFGGHYVLKGKGPERFRSFNWIGFRYLRLRVTNAFEDVRLKSCRVVVSRYPYRQIDSFSTEDTVLQRVFDLSRYTIRLCSNEFLMDTPWREQGQWLGDVAAVTLGGIYACFGDTALPAKYFRQCGMNQLSTGLITNMTNSVSFDWRNVIPDYSLWWIHALWNHYRYTGEIEWIHRYFPHVVRILQYFERYLDDSGLLYRVPGWVFIDWANVDKRGYCAALNGIYSLALGAAEKMAGLRGDAHYADQYRVGRRAIRDTFTTMFFDEERGVCIDAADGEWRSDRVSEQANAMAVLEDLVDTARKRRIIANVLSGTHADVVESQPFFCTFTLLALKKEERMDLAIETLRTRWGERMAEESSAREEWGINGSWRTGDFTPIMRTLSHAWSAYPAEFLVRELIGFRITEAGCGQIGLNPADIGVDYVVRMPLPQGLVTVEMRNGTPAIQLPEGVMLV